MHFTLLGQRNSLESWKDKLHSDVNIPTETVAKCFQDNHFQVDS